MAYPSVILGWHWGWRRSGTGLPVQVSANRNVNTGWNFGVQQNGTNTMNVAYDLWFHNNLVARGWMSNSKYLTSVQAGSEIFTGNGQLNVNPYYYNIQ